MRRSLLRVAPCSTVAALAAWMVLMCSDVQGGRWVQTDWSGPSGQWAWSDISGYWEGSGINGSLFPGELFLSAPNTAGWSSTGSIFNSFSILSLCKDDSGSIYAGAADGFTLGHVYKSTDAGNNWTEPSPLPGTPWMVRALINTPQGLFAGTGKTYGGAVYRSTDGGTSWDTTAGLSDIARVNALLWSTQGRLYLGGSHATVMYSVDAGTTWDSTGVLEGAYEVNALGETQSGVVLVGVTTTDLKGRVYATPDSGATWDTMGGAFPYPVRALLVDRFENIYAGVGNGENAGCVYRSTDQGQTWDTTGALVDSRAVNALFEGYDGAVYAGVACIDSTVTDSIGRVFRSTDGGATWDTTSLLAGTQQVFSLLQVPTGVLFAGSGLGTNNGKVFRAGYIPQGYLVSSVYDTGERSDWGTMPWNETANGESLSFQVRSGSDSSLTDAAPWDSCPPALNGQDLSLLSSVHNGDRFLQYRVSLSTTEPGVSPVLHEVQMGFGPTGIADQPDTPLPGLPKLSLSVSPNPVTGTRPWIMLTVPFRQTVSLSAFDISGRFVGELFRGEASAGAHRLEWDLNGTNSAGTGVYFLRLSGMSENAVTRAIVLR